MFALPLNLDCAVALYLHSFADVVDCCVHWKCPIDPTDYHSFVRLHHYFVIDPPSILLHLSSYDDDGLQSAQATLRPMTFG